jgi:hypothetical protein
VKVSIADEFLFNVIYKPFGPDLFWFPLFFGSLIHSAITLTILQKINHSEKDVHIAILHMPRVGEECPRMTHSMRDGIRGTLIITPKWLRGANPQKKI